MTIPNDCATNSAIDLVELGRFTRSNRELEVEVLTLFAGHLPVTLGLLAADASPNDWKYATHTIKGAARSVGAASLARAAAAAELAPRDERGQHVDAIRAEADAALDFVARFTAEHRGPVAP